MVYLPTLRLGDTELSEGLLVSVCDGCANERTKGLLGLNVMREFFVQMDYQAERMHLIPRQHEGRPNRAYDIGPTVKADVEGNPAIWLGRIRWILLVKNRGTTAIERVIPEVQFSDGQKIRGAVDRAHRARRRRPLARRGQDPDQERQGRPRLHHQHRRGVLVMLLAIDTANLPLYVAILVPVAVLVYYLGNVRAQRG
jgi:hypothetical protein